MSSCASSFPKVKLCISYPRSEAVHRLSQRSHCTPTVPEDQLSQRSGYASTVPKVKLCLNCTWSHCLRGQFIHPLSLGPSCTSTVPEVRLYIYCPWVKLYIHCPRGQAVHPLTSSPVSTDGGGSAELVEGSLFSSLCKLAGQQKSNTECHCHAQFAQAKAVLLQFFGHKWKKLSNGKGVFCFVIVVSRAMVYQNLNKK